MNKLLARCAGVMVTLFFFVAFLGATEKTITILHVNDTHSHLDAFGPKDFHLNGTVGGIAKAATVIGTIRATEPNVILLHAGDVFHGDFFFNKYLGVPELQLMQQLGFDAMAVGNHEFDFGPDVLAGSLLAAFGTPQNGLPLLAANVIIPDGQAIKEWVKSSVVLTKAGIKFGVFGMTVPGDPTTSPAPVVIHSDPELFQDAMDAITALQGQGAQIIICLSHLGILYDQALATNVPGIDFILGGHDQIVLEQPMAVPNPGGKQTLILQAGEFYKYVGKLTIKVDDKGSLAAVKYRLLPVTCSTPKDPTIQAVVEGLKKGIEQQYGDVYHKVIGIAVKELSRKYDEAGPLRDTPLGNLVTDACRRKGKTDISMAAFGFISEKIYAGAIVGADVFRAMSYGFDQASGLGFKLVKIRMNGIELVKGLETTLSFLGLSDDFFLQVSGMRYKYDATQPVGSRVILESIRINGETFNPAADYTVTVNEGIAALLPMMGVTATVLEALPDFEYTVVRDYIKHLGIVYYKPQGRILDVSARNTHRSSAYDEPLVMDKSAVGGPGTVVSEFQLGQNYPNPFNPTTTIIYAVPTNAHVTLRIFDMLGREVAKLVDEEMPAGRHEATWNATGCGSGVYFYSLRSDNSVSVKKLTLLR